MVQNNKIKIEVAYATPEKQYLLALEVMVGTTIEEAIQQSGILTMVPAIDLSKQAVGVFGKKRKLSDVVGLHDRIEIYRPLSIDPKEARRAKARLRK